MNDDINEGCVAGEEICGGRGFLLSYLLSCLMLSYTVAYPSFCYFETKSMSEFGGITTKLKSMSRMDIPIWDNFLSFPNENTIN